MSPPAKGITADHSSRIAAQVATADGLGRFVDIAHHQEQNIAYPKGVPLPRTLDLAGPFLWVHTGEFGVRTHWIDPFLPPPRGWFVEAASVMIAAYAIDGFPWMLQVYFCVAMKDSNNMKTQSKEMMAWTIREALKQQGKCSREDWLSQLDQIHGSKTGPLPKKEFCRTLSTVGN
jgi:hypothetical protein